MTAKASVRVRPDTGQPWPLTSRSLVDQEDVGGVELTYKSGPAVRVSGVEGGFVLLAEPGRGSTEVIALGADGEEIGLEPIEYPLVDETPEPPPPGIEGSGHASPGSNEP